MRLLCRVLDDGVAVGKRCRHHDIDGRSHGDHIQIDVTSPQLFGVHNDDAVLDLHLRAQRAEALDMLIDRTASDLTAARQYNFRLLVLAQKSAYQIVGRPDLSYIFIIYQQVSAGIDILSADQYFIVALADYSRPNLLHGLEQDVGISYIRHIVDQTLTICHDRCR